MALILVVEDEVDIRDDIEDILRFGGHQTVAAGNGKDAFDIAMKARPDLILSDINMPEMDGGQFLEKLRRERPEVANTPFVFLSAYAEREAVIEGKKIGADDYVTKPIDHDLLLETVNARLRQMRRLDEQKREELDALRRSVLDTFPHELRTPLNSIIGFAELLAGSSRTAEVPKTIRDYAAHMLEAGRRLHDVIERVLDLVAVTTGKLVPKEREIDVRGLLDSCVSLMAASIERRQLALRINISSRMTALKSDETFLRRAVLELLGNAIKFTDHGGSVVLNGGLDDQGHPTISVVDTGIGIAAEALPRVGTPFFQASSGRSREHEGLGLGINVARAFVETLGGRIEMQSQLRVGTTARIVLGKEAAIVSDR
jgi:signal transduction histidine kinase